jgi:hypothetical protein
MRREISGALADGVGAGAARGPGLLGRTVSDELERPRGVGVALIRTFSRRRRPPASRPSRTWRAQLTDGRTPSAADRCAIDANGRRNTRVSEISSASPSGTGLSSSLVQTLKVKSTEVHELCARLKK